MFVVALLYQDWLRGGPTQPAAGGVIHHGELTVAARVRSGAGRDMFTSTHQPSIPLAQVWPNTRPDAVCARHRLAQTAVNYDYLFYWYLYQVRPWCAMLCRNSGAMGDPGCMA